MNDKNQKLIENAEINVKGNIIECFNFIIQISNISQVWTGRIPKKPLPIITIIISILFGFGLMRHGLNTEEAKFFFYGIIIFIAIITYVIIHFNKKQVYGLSIVLNSGQVWFFSSTNVPFVLKVKEVIGNIIEDNNLNETYIVNFGSGTIVNESTNVKVKI